MFHRTSVWSLVAIAEIRLIVLNSIGFNFGLICLTTNLLFINIMSLIIFTGLDGILLPSEDIDYDPVVAIIKNLQQRNIPLIPVTNNTRAEVEDLLNKIGLNTSFVVEQGSGIFVPQDNSNFNVLETEIVDNYHLHQLGCSYTEARAALKAVQEEISKILRGFGDLDEENIQAMMGVSSAAAKRAKSREFSEYFLTPSRLEIEKLQEVAEEYGFKIIPESKLSLVAGGKADEGKAVGWLKKNYQSTNSDKVVTVGLGSTKSDLSLLSAVDIPIIVPSSTEIDPAFADKDWQIANGIGSIGWINAIAP